MIDLSRSERVTEDVGTAGDLPASLAMILRRIQAKHLVVVKLEKRVRGLEC